MANEGQGEHHVAVNGIQLMQTFSHIAESTRTADAFASEFGKVVSDSIASTVVLNHL